MASKEPDCPQVKAIFTCIEKKKQEVLTAMSKLEAKLEAQ